jgi:hypothetical protein
MKAKAIVDLITLDHFDQVIAASLKTVLGKNHPCEKP